MPAYGTRQAHILFLAILLPLTSILTTAPNVKHEGLLWIPIRKALRAYNVVIETLFTGHNTRKGMALDNPTLLQMLQKPS